MHANAFTHGSISLDAAPSTAYCIIVLRSRPRPRPQPGGIRRGGGTTYGSRSSAGAALAERNAAAAMADCRLAAACGLRVVRVWTLSTLPAVGRPRGLRG